MPSARSRRIPLMALVALAFACRTAPVLNVTDAPVPAGLTADQVREAIRHAGAQRGWSIDDAGAGQLRGDLQLRGHSASVDIAYSPTGYSIRYRDSKNLRYDGTVIHKNYNGWVINLRRSIDRELAREASAGGAPH